MACPAARHRAVAEPDAGCAGILRAGADERQRHRRQCGAGLDGGGNPCAHQGARACRSRPLRRRPGDDRRPRRAAGRQGFHGDAVQHHQLHGQVHRGSTGAGYHRRDFRHRSHRVQQWPDGHYQRVLLHPWFRLSHRRRFLRRSVRHLALLPGLARDVRAHRRAQGSVRAAQRHAARRFRRRQRQPGSEARRGRSAGAPDGHLYVRRAVRHPRGPGPALRRQQAVRHPLQRRVPRRRRRDQQPEAQVAAGFAGPGLARRARPSRPTSTAAKTTSRARRAASAWRPASPCPSRPGPTRC